MRYHQLTQSQRHKIEIYLAMGQTLSAIARQIGVHKSTVSREVRRNRGPGAYGGSTAHGVTHHRRRAAFKRTKHSTWIAAFIEHVLTEEQWSPEQISQVRRRDQQEWVSHEWIYRYIWNDKQAGGSLYRHLRTRYKPYRKRYGSRNRRGNREGTVNIRERPAISAQRSRIGDWEMDTVSGKNGQAVLVTAVERKSRYTLIGKAPHRTSDAVLQTLLAMFRGLKRRVHTMTCDNGPEFARHRELARQLKGLVYFCDPYHSWQRGTNENTNGLIRQYFPKNTNFDKVKPIQVKRVMEKLNRRPRKILGFHTPGDVFVRGSS